jgi:deazaflavin-dependent oxidoreductase (nitroreductase family)
VDEAVRRTLAAGGIIDITTTGRRSGLPRRIEIVLHAIDGRLYISGIPRADRKRAWLANLEADPRLVVHLKRGVPADLPAAARLIDGEAERRSVLPAIARAWGRTDLEAMVAHSPLIEVSIEGYGPG